MSAPDFIQTATLEDAVSALRDRPCRILAGGTDLMPKLRDSETEPGETVLDISRIAELRTIEFRGNALHIGALATWADLDSFRLPHSLTALRDAALGLAGPQIRNAATVCGNLCNASPASDGSVVLKAFGATVELQSARQTRLLPMEHFLLGPGKTACRPHELVTGVTVPIPGALSASVFLKTGSRQANIIATCSAAVSIGLYGSTFKHAGIAVGACSAVPVRLRSLEAAILAHTPDRAVMDLVTPAHFAALSPISDIRASAAYRSAAAQSLVARAFAEALKRISG